MASKCLPTIAKNFSAVDCYLVGSNRVSRAACVTDYNTIVVGLTMWYGIVLDYNAMVCEGTRLSTNRGRVLKHALTSWNMLEGNLHSFLTYLDQLGDTFLGYVSDPDGFKGDLFLYGMKTMSVDVWLQPLHGVLHAIFSAGLECSAREEDKVQVVRMIRQVSCFLKKLDIDRPDLKEESMADFFALELALKNDIALRCNSVGYLTDVFDMKTLLQEHLHEFHLAPLVPGHGPGAVSQSSVKCWYDKHTEACCDARLELLLDHACLGRQSDFLPLIKDAKSTRTSRFICVPKTWKKLRGISAEPAELQFFQQALLRSIDRMFTNDSWWAKRINLHDQHYSRDLALQGSKSGDYATVDLSAASDSVTLQLVRDLFGSTVLGRWLIGTRSTHTQCGDSIVRITKFAPMGSACCFPVETMIFCLAAEVAVSRTRKPSENIRQVRVFGDDIIVPSYATVELFSILSNLGFSVNTEKSFWKGSFREACGMEAWAGHDIAPCRYRKLQSGPHSPDTSHDEVLSIVAFANELFVRDLHGTREYLLSLLFGKSFKLSGGIRFPVQKTVLVTFSGECSTLASPLPTNFNLNMKFSRRVWTKLFQTVVWQERSIDSKRALAYADSYDVCKYTDWLIRHQPGVLDFDQLWRDGWVEEVDENPYSRLPIGTTMVPTVKWAFFTSYNFL